MPPYPGYGYGIFVPARNFCKFCTPVPQYPEHLEVLQDFHARTRNFCELCRTFIPVPGTSVSSVRPAPQYPGYGYSIFLYPPGTSVSSVRPCHNTQNFCEFCNTSMPVPETSASSVRLPYLYPESTNPTEHNLGKIVTTEFGEFLIWTAPRNGDPFRKRCS